MYKMKLEHIKGFCELFTVEDELFCEYHPLSEYEIIIDSKTLSVIFQENVNIDKVEVFDTFDNASVPMTWDSEVNVKINRITKKELAEDLIIKNIISNAIGCLQLDMLQRYAIKDNNVYEFRVNKYKKNYNKNINNINTLGYDIIFNEDDIKIEVEVKKND